jgi:hypothetical protein
MGVGYWAGIGAPWRGFWQRLTQRFGWRVSLQPLGVLIILGRCCWRIS